MALNPVVYTENVVRSFLRYQLTTYSFADPGLRRQMRDLLSLDHTRSSPLLKGPYISLSRPFRDGSPVESLVAEGLLHPHLRERIPAHITHLRRHQEEAIRAIVAGKTTLISTGTGSGKTECFLYPIISKCLQLRDDNAAPGISAVVVYPMNALAEDQLMRLRGLLAGTGIPFGIYVGKTPEGEADVTGFRLPHGASRADYEARLARVRREGSGETVHPFEEVCSRQIMRTAGRQPRILLTNVKQLELLLTRQRDIQLFADARLDLLVFDEAHTFTGALGAETACLIRRLRAFCGAGTDRTTCVATSATIVDKRQPEAARSFAARFFGVNVDSVKTVGEAYDEEVWAEPRFVPPAPAPGTDAAAILEDCVRGVDAEDAEEDAHAAVRTAYRALASADLPSGDWPAALHSALSRNELVFRLNEELGAPRALNELPPALRHHLGRDVTEAEVLAWLTLGAAARRDGRPLLRPVMHSFVRGISGAVATFPQDRDGPKLWLAAADTDDDQEFDNRHITLPVTTCTTCGQHYYIAFLEDFSFTRKRPGGGRAGRTGSCWQALDKTRGGKRVVLIDKLIAEHDEDEGPAHKRTAQLHFCRHCGTAHPDAAANCHGCGVDGRLVELLAVRQNPKNPGVLTSCLACGAVGRRVNGRYREPARPVRAISVADVHVLTQDMVHHAQRRRLLVFCDNRQDAAFQAGWMKDHARRFRLRALMADGIKASPSSVGDLVGYLDDRLEDDETLSRALAPEVWQLARREAGRGGRHQQERRKFLRFQVLREVALSPRQALGLEPWGRMKVDYVGLEAALPWIQEHAHALGVSPEEMLEGVAGVLDYVRRRRALHDPEYEIFTKYWMDGDREIQQGYLPNFFAPNGTKLRRGATEEPKFVTQWLSDRGDTPMRQVARKWDVPEPDIERFLESLFELLVDCGLLTSVQLKGSRGRPLPNVAGVYQVNADRLRLNPHRGVRRCQTCRRTTTRSLPHQRCMAWRCDGVLEWVPEDEDDYNMQLLDGAYLMLRPEEHTAMVPHDERERLENLFKGASDAVNCLVCTPTLELGIDIGRLDSVLMRNVPPLPTNYWQRAGRAGRRHRMAVDFTYCRPASHDRAYFQDPRKLLAGRIDPPAFNLRNEVMVAKHVRATVIGSLRRYSDDDRRPEAERTALRTTLAACLPRNVAPYLFDDSQVRTTPFDFGPLRRLVANHADELTTDVQRVFEQGWPEADADVIAPDALRSCVSRFACDLEKVVVRLRRRLRWAMRQIRRLNTRRHQQGTLEPADEALFRRCDNLVKRLKGRTRRRSWAQGHDDYNTFNVLAAEGFLPGYGLEVGSVVGWADIPFWRMGAMDFILPRPPATALREYVPGNLIYANGHRFVARRFHRDVDEEQVEMPVYEVSSEPRAVRLVEHGASAALGRRVLKTMAICDADLVHSSHISDEEDLRFQLGVDVRGMEIDQHNGGDAYRWGSQDLHLRHGVRLRLVNVGTSSAFDGRAQLGYPVCTVCGQSISPYASERQRNHFTETHLRSCDHAPGPIGFYADVVADAISLPACDDQVAACSVLEALRFGASSVLDMHMEDLQVLVIGHVDRQQVDGLLWDPMPGGSGLLQRLCERFPEVVAAARQVVANCPAVCDVSCIDCLQTFRNAYYHRDLNRKVAYEQLEEWGSELSVSHDIPPRQAATKQQNDKLPVNDAETKLLHLLLAAGFDEGIRGEQIRLQSALGSTTPDVIYRTDDHEPDEGVCIYLDGLSKHIHGNPETADRDRNIRTWLRNSGYDVIEIAASDLHDRKAMTSHFRRLARYLGQTKTQRRSLDDPSWFRSPEQPEEQPEPVEAGRLRLGSLRQRFQDRALVAGEPVEAGRLRFVSPSPDRRYVTCVPLVPLDIAAGEFRDSNAIVDESASEWVEIDATRPLRSGMFVARVDGRSMEPRIPDGSYCLFASPVTGTRQGRTVLVKMLNATDPDTGQQFTVKRYRSEKTVNEDSWRHEVIVLEPLNPDYEPIEITPEDESSVNVIAELIEVIGTAAPYRAE